MRLLKGSAVLPLWIYFAGSGFSFLHASEKAITYFGRLEYWNESNALDGTKDFLNKGLSNINNLGGKVSPLEVSENPGFGGRIGLFSNKLLSGLGIGLSLGYVQGPSGKFHYSGDPFVVGTTHYSGAHGFYESKLRYVRALIEGQKSFPINKLLELRIGAGAGIANGHLSYHWTEEYFSPSIDPTNISGDKSWTGFTWEIVPSVGFKINKSILDVGLIFAKFPTYSGSSDYSNFSGGEVKWSPWGIRVGYEF